MRIWRPVRARPDVWGPWITLAIGAGIAAVFVLVQLVIVYAGVLYRTRHGQPASMPAVAASMGDNGLAFSIVTLASSITCCMLTWWAAKLRKSATAADYLGMHAVRAGQLLAWTGVAAGLMAVSDLAEPLLKNPQGPDFTLSLYRSADFIPLLWVAAVIAAPAFEELFFRGFLLQGLRYSRIGPVGAVVLTSLVWAASHGQYSHGEIVEIFIFGLFLGIARIRTGSIYTSFAMHAFVNMATLVQAAWMSGSH